MYKKQYLLFALVLAALLSLAGCGGQAPTLPALPSAADAQKALCDSLAGLNNSVASLANVDPSSAVNDIKALKANVDTAVQASKAANAVLNRPAITDLTTSYDNLALQINGLADGQTIGPVAEANIAAGVKTLQDALAQARTALSCPAQ